MKKAFTLAIALTVLQTITGPPHSLLVQRLASASRVDVIRSRGYLLCGIAPGIAGFAETHGTGAVTGFDADLCRAVAVAILGSAEAVRFKQATSLEEFLAASDIDLVSRRLTWTLERETSFDVSFGPIVFYDGQGFLVRSRLKSKHVADLAGLAICVDPGTAAERRLSAYFRERNRTFVKRPAKGPAALEQQFESGECDAYTADVSELASILSRMRARENFGLLPDQISKEPLAPLVRNDDRRFLQIVRWTIYVLFTAEELKVTSGNIAVMRQSADPDIRRLLGIMPGIGSALGLDEKWAERTIHEVGNYEQIYDRNLGQASAVKLDRGLNRLWTDGGLLYAPPLR
jgi:general L-amino acid transport system substrate-binding protein